MYLFFIVNLKKGCNCSAGLRIYIANKVRFADREKA